MKEILHPENHPPEGILLVDKAKGRTSFSLVNLLRRKLGIKKIGHAGTLDPFATGVMVMLVGRTYTRLSNQFLCNDKEYEAEVLLGAATSTYDCDGSITYECSQIPSSEDVQKMLERFQGEIEQIPPMFSAKKIQGKRLYKLARQGIEIERKPVKITVDTQMLTYEPPYLKLRIVCSKGTYIRSIAHDLGVLLGCGAHLTNLRRTRSGRFSIEECLTELEIASPDCDLSSRLRTE